MEALRKNSASGIFASIEIANLDLKSRPRCKNPTPNNKKRCRKSADCRPTATGLPSTWRFLCSTHRPVSPNGTLSRTKNDLKEKKNQKKSKKFFVLFDSLEVPQPPKKIQAAIYYEQSILIIFLSYSNWFFLLIKRKINSPTERVKGFSHPERIHSTVAANWSPYLRFGTCSLPVDTPDKFFQVS